MTGQNKVEVTNVNSKGEYPIISILTNRGSLLISDSGFF